MAIKVTLHRSYPDGKDQITRTFNNGEGWQIATDGRVIVTGAKDNTIAVFLPNTVESVESVG